MSADPTRRAMRDSLGITAPAGLAVLCYIGPALLAAGALGVLGSWLANPWLIGAAVLLALAVMGRRLRPRSVARRLARPAPSAAPGDERPPHVHSF